LKVTKSLHIDNATQWQFDFAADFVFPALPITNVQYSIEIDAAREGETPAFARHASRPPTGPNGQQVVVETDVPVSGKVTITATQGLFTTGNY
jgi:hypothetical protein